MALGDGLTRLSGAPLAGRTARVGLEEFADGRRDLWIPARPGVHARVAPGDPLAQGRAALAAFSGWLEQHDLPVPEPLALAGVERQAVSGVADPPARACFTDDHLPVDEGELAEVLGWLAASREDLLSPLAGLDDAALEQPVARGLSIRQSLDHLADTEAWYASRLDPLAGERDLIAARPAAPPLERLAAIRDDLESILRQRLDALAGARTTVAGETWTLRKVLRRSLAHERWHTAQIERLARRLAESAWFEGQGPDQDPAGRPPRGEG